MAERAAAALVSFFKILRTRRPEPGAPGGGVLNPLRKAQLLLQHLNSRLNPCHQRRDSRFQWEIRRCLQSVGAACLVSQEIKCLRPLRPVARIKVGTDDAMASRAPLNQLRGIDGTDLCYAGNYCLS